MWIQDRSPHTLPLNPALIQSGVMKGLTILTENFLGLPL